MYYSHEWIHDLRVLPALDLVIIGILIGMLVALIVFKSGGGGPG